MAIYGIGDLHLSTFNDKPMDIFGGWSDYISRIENNWEQRVNDEDLVVIPGDLSWANNIDEARDDFGFVHKLSGRKIILKGNHDYWFSTAAKVSRFISENGFNSISVLNNNSFRYNDIAIAGTRGWILDHASNENMKVYSREVQRLRLSLEDAKRGNPNEIIAFLHFPPIYANYEHPEIIELLTEYGVKRCFYGHVHGNSINYAVNDIKYGIMFKLISADYLQFAPYLIEI